LPPAPAPARQPREKPAEPKPEEERQDQPQAADGKRLAARRDRPPARHITNVEGEERDEEERRDLARGTLARACQEPRRAQGAVRHRDENHRKPGEQVAAHRHYGLALRTAGTSMRRRRRATVHVDSSAP